MTDIVVIPPGAKVTLEGGIPAMVACVGIRERGAVIYEVVWWNGRERNSCWVGGSEITVTNYVGTPTRIGFAAGGNDGQ